MTTSQHKLVFVGAGLSSLLVAQCALEEARARGCSLSVTFVDADFSPGGLYKSHSYANDLTFDDGMHIFYETGDISLDGLWLSLLSDSEWCVLSGNKRDIAGIFYEGRLQKYSPYLDLRYKGLSQWIRDTFSISKALIRNPRHARELSPDDVTAEDYFVHRFGQGVYTRYFLPVLRKVFGSNGSDLPGISTQLLALNRVVILPIWIMRILVYVRSISNRVAFPNQMKLPKVRKSDFRGLYPKRMGIGVVTSRLRSQLEREGAKFYLGARVHRLSLDADVVSKIHYSTCDGVDSSINCEDAEIFWNAGPATLERVARSSGIFAEAEMAEKQHSESRTVQAIVDCTIRNPNHISPLYYFYCFDQRYRTFRVTNFAGYCPGASCDGWDQICVEMWVPSSWDAEQIQSSAVMELLAMKVVGSAEELRVLGTRTLPSGFPLLTLERLQRLRATSGDIRRRSLRNLVAVGAASDPNIFFLRDVLLNVKLEVWSRLSWD